jgi:DNA mismatch repair ATPase MutS
LTNAEYREENEKLREKIRELMRDLSDMRRLLQHKSMYSLEDLP